MTTIICQYTGIEFEAKSARVKNHPEIASLLAEAQKVNRYGIALEAIQNARTAGVTEITDFVSLARAAVKTNRATEMAEARRMMDERAARETERINRIRNRECGNEYDNQGELWTERDEREVNAKMVATRTSEF